MRVVTRMLVLLCCASAVLLEGCVKEVRVRDTRTTRSVPDSGTQGTLLGEPVASPALAAQVVNSRVVVAVKPLGRVPFDGQVLPIITPNGSHLLAQTTRAPSWEMLLAMPGAGVPLATELERFRLAESPERSDSSDELPVDAITGRSAFGSTALIERIAPDGTRRITSVTLSTRGGSRDISDLFGSFDSVLAHATTDASGSVFAATTHPVDNPGAADLVVAWSSNGERFHVRESLPGAALRFPTLSADGRMLTVFAQSASGTELVTYSVGERPWSGQAPLVMTARRVISSSEDPLVAYQAISGQQSPAVVPRVDGELVQPPGILFFHPAQQRMALFDPRVGSLTFLEQQSIAGAWYARQLPDGSLAWSVFLTTPDGLKHQALSPSRSGWTAQPAATVMKEVFVPRATTDPDRPFILIGPSASNPAELDVFLMRVQPGN